MGGGGGEENLKRGFVGGDKKFWDFGLGLEFCFLDREWLRDM